MGNTEHQLVFGIKDQKFSVHVKYVNSIIQLPKLFKVPQAPDYISGVINVEGDVIPVIDSGIKIKMDAIELNELSQVVILQREELKEKKVNRLGFLVDEVKDVADFDPLKIQPLPMSKYHFDERMVDGMHKQDKDFIMQINVENLFKEEIDELFAETEIN
jgi:purine-binding chemotaxis protein CheW